MACELRSHGMVLVSILITWTLSVAFVEGTTTARPVGLEGIPDLVDANDEALENGAITTSSPDTHEINCHFSLHKRSRVGGRCMSLGYQGIKTCVASIIYLDAGNADCINQDLK